MIEGFSSVSLFSRLSHSQITSITYSMANILPSWCTHLVRVSPIHVLGAVGCVGEGLPAPIHFADVWSLPGVRTEMGLQVFQPGVSFAALLILYVCAVWGVCGVGCVWCGVCAVWGVCIHVLCNVSVCVWWGQQERGEEEEISNNGPNNYMHVFIS